MDQQNWESEPPVGPAYPEIDAEFSVETPAEAFYLALKLALTRLKEYSAATTG